MLLVILFGEQKIMATWSNEDSIKLFLISLFVIAFIVVIKALLNAEKQLNSKTKKDP